MERIHLPLLLVCLYLAMPSQAQWSNDPDAPLVICDAPGTQRYLSTVEDGAGGWYAFWIDERNGDAEVYGQRVDSDGYPLWAANGIPVASVPGSVVRGVKACRLGNGDLMVVYSHGVSAPGDSLSAMRYDTDGMPVWAMATSLVRDSVPFLRVNEFNVLAAANGAFVLYARTVLGGAGRRYIDRVRNDGSLVVGIDGSLVSNTGGSIQGLDATSDGGAITHWRNGNGVGTHMGALRVDSLCAPVWPASVDPVDGGPGLAYAYNATSDGQDGLAIVFVEATSPRRISFTRLDGNGNAAITPAIKTVGMSAFDQDLPWMVMHDGHFMVAWEDARPPANNQDLYAQKLDMNGDPVWDAAGEPAVLVQTYIPHTKLVPSDSGGVIVTQLTISAGFQAQRLRSDGTTAWANAAVLAGAQHVPLYEEFTMHPHTDGGAVAFWYNNDDNDLYAAHVDFHGSIGVTSGVDETASSTGLQVWPNPTTGQVRVRVMDRLVQGTYAVQDAAGRTVRTGQVAGQAVVDLSGAAPGPYLVEVRWPEGVARARVVLE